MKPAAIVLIAAALLLGSNPVALEYFDRWLTRLWRRISTLVARRQETRNGDVKTSDATEVVVRPPEPELPGCGEENLLAAEVDFPAQCDSGLPEVVLARATLDQLAAETSDYLREFPGMETGYALVGRIDETKGGRRILIRGLIPAGESAQRSATHVAFDRDYQQRELDLMRILDPWARHVGDAHVHPGCYDRCSPGDYETDLQNVVAADGEEMVFVIMTARPCGLFAQSDCLIERGLKLDFYYLGRASGFRYRKVVPTLSPTPPLVVGPSLRAFADADPLRVAMDLHALTRLPGLDVRILESTRESHGDGRLCIDLVHRGGRYKATFLLGEHPALRPRVLVATAAGSVQEWESDLLESHWTPDAWLTPVAFALQKEMAGQAIVERRNDKEDAASCSDANDGVNGPIAALSVSGAS